MPSQSQRHLSVRGSGRSSRPAPHVRRRSVVYGIPTLPVDRRTGQIIPGAPPVVGYIGKSVQTLFQRQQQHRDDQPFSDTICGGAWVIEEGFWTDVELAAREEWWIRGGVALVPGRPVQRPVYNYEHNLDNPERIEIWRAREHRQRREPGWVPGVQRVSRQRGGFTGRARRRVSVRWTRRRVVAALLAAVWVALAALFWWAGWDVWPGWAGPRNAGVGASVVMASAAMARRRLLLPKRRRRRRRRRW